MPAGSTWAGQKWVEEEELEGTFSATLGRRSTTRVQCHQISFSLHSSRIVSLRRIRPRLNSWRGLSSPPLPHSPTFRERLTYHLQERHSIKLCNIKGNEIVQTRPQPRHGQEERTGEPDTLGQIHCCRQKWFVSTQSNYTAGCTSEKAAQGGEKEG